MAHDEDIIRLEQFVEKLLASHNDLQQEYQALEARLAEGEQLNEDLRNELGRLQEDRKVAKTRVVGLIDRIEAWEKENGGAEPVVQEVPAAAPPEEVLSLFPVGPAGAPEVSGPEEGEK